MSLDRVIQDSDDEDDPLLEERPPRDPPPVVHQSDNRASYRESSNDPLNDSSRQFAVDFDQFLGSQDGGQPGATSSQQQREERWIPSNAGGGSIGETCVLIKVATGTGTDQPDSWSRDYDERDRTCAAAIVR